MEQANPEGAVAPVETPPVAASDGAAPETVKPAAADTTAQNPDKKEHWASKRIKEVSDDRNYWRDLAMRQQHPLQQRQEAASSEEPDKDLKDFNYDEKAYRRYQDARVEAQAEKAALRYAKRHSAEQEAIRRRAKFDERVDAFAKNVKDFSDVVTDATPVSEAMADYIEDSEEAGALLYYLGNNPDEARKLFHKLPHKSDDPNGLSPKEWAKNAAKISVQLEKLEERLVAERKKAAEKPVSQAPPPAPTIEAAGDAGRKADPTAPESDELSDAEWLRKREKQVQAKRK